MNWKDPQNVAQLKLLWSMGLSASQIAGQMGNGCTRNAVIGAVFRLRLPPHATAKRTQAVRKKVKPLRPKPQVSPLQALRRDGMPLPEPQKDDIARVSIFDVEHHHCRWPSSSTEQDKHGNPLVFCGSDKIPGLPYCRAHSVRAFNPVQPRRRETDWRTVKEVQVA